MLATTTVPVATAVPEGFHSVNLIVPVLAVQYMRAPVATIGSVGIMDCPNVMSVLPKAVGVRACAASAGDHHRVLEAAPLDAAVAWP